MLPNTLVQPSWGSTDEASEDTSDNASDELSVDSLSLMIEDVSLLVIESVLAVVLSSSAAVQAVTERTETNSKNIIIFFTLNLFVFFYLSSIVIVLTIIDFARFPFGAFNVKSLYAIMAVLGPVITSPVLQQVYS